METAVDWLRTKGLASAAKKASRTAAEGLVGVAVSLARKAPSSRSIRRPTSSPRTTSSRIVRAHRHRQWRSTHGEDIELLLAALYPDGGDGMTVKDVLTNNIATIGENQSVAPGQDRRGQRGRRRALYAQRCRQRAGQDRRARRVWSRRRRRTCSNRWAARSRCTSPRQTRWRSNAEWARPGRRRARAQDRRAKRRPDRASRRTSSEQDGRGRRPEVPPRKTRC